MKCSFFSCILTVACCFSLSNDASAQQPLRWKFEEGQQLTAHLEQQTSSTVTVANKPVKTAIEMSLDLRWQVDAVMPAGTKITQTVERVRVNMQPQGDDSVEYDSASSKKPVGRAKDMAAAVMPLVGAKFHVVMTDRGEITAAEPSAELSQRLAQDDAATGRGQLYSRKASVAYYVTR